MKAAIVRAAGQAPVFGDFAPARPRGDEQLIDVAASSLSPVTRSRASGSHYSSSGGVPFVVGVDGVGRLANGHRVFFITSRAPYGAMAQQTVALRAHCVPVPDALDDVTAAAIANPGMSSWAALTERAKIRGGETVLINGATGSAGRLAVQIAKWLGAGKVIATGRDLEALYEVESLGADASVALTNDADALEHRFAPHFAAGVDIVLDYLWGSSAERLLRAAATSAPDGRRMRVVQIGAASGGAISLPSAVLRASAIELMGSGIGSLGLDRLVAATDAVLQAVGPAGLKLATHAVPLSTVDAAWNDGAARVRTVFTP